LLTNLRPDMRNLYLTIICLCFYIYTSSQDIKGISFELEELSKPESYLKTVPFEELYSTLIAIDYKDNTNTISSVLRDNSTILAKSFGNELLVADFGYNPFFLGLCEAYAHHRPVVLSPDVIWILICQGFANHINNNSEKYRDLIVGFEGKKELSVILENTPKEADWYSVIDSFYTKISDNLKIKLAETLLCDFSTSDSVDRLVSEVTTMEVVKSYYDFVVFYSICGIPSITLTGTVEDWEHLKEKILELEKYDLKWWTKRLIPIIDGFINSSSGHVDIEFWKKMIHVTEPDQCGDSRIIDGWITDFYPYDKEGNKLRGGKITDTDKLPSEIVKIKIHARDIIGNNYNDLNEIEVWAGIMGLEQTMDTYSITPRTGWFVRSLDQASMDFAFFSRRNTPNNIYGIQIVVDSIPSILSEFEHIYRLDITFNNKAYLPVWMESKKIDNIILRGKIPLKERKKAKMWFNNVSFNPGHKYPIWFRKLFFMGHDKQH